MGDKTELCVIYMWCYRKSSRNDIFFCFIFFLFLQMFEELRIGNTWKKDMSRFKGPSSIIRWQDILKFRSDQRMYLPFFLEISIFQCNVLFVTYIFAEGLNSFVHDKVLDCSAEFAQEKNGLNVIVLLLSTNF